MTDYLITPLHIASQRGSLETVRTLVQHGAALDASDAFAYQPLHYAARRDQPAMVAFLIERGA